MRANLITQLDPSTHYWLLTAVAWTLWPLLFFTGGFLVSALFLHRFKARAERAITNNEGLRAQYAALKKVEQISRLGR